MNIQEAARIARISIRTLRHYDRIGLLSPSRDPHNDYRTYTDDDLDRLQQILFFKACGFSLEQIGQLLNRPDFDREAAFGMQRDYLAREKQRIETMLMTLDKSLSMMRGEQTMSNEEKFAGFDFTHNPYEEEARQLWGDEAVENSKQHLQSKSQDQRQMMSDQMNALFRQLATLRNEQPDSADVQQAIESLFRFLNRETGHTYTPEAFAGLGQMYMADERFTANIDQYGEGLSAFLAEAMGIYARQRD